MLINIQNQIRNSNIYRFWIDILHLRRCWRPYGAAMAIVPSSHRALFRTPKDVHSQNKRRPSEFCPVLYDLTVLLAIILRSPQRSTILTTLWERHHSVTGVLLSD